MEAGRERREASLAGSFGQRHHEQLGIAGTFGFYAAYGFFACVVLVLMAKVLRLVLKRPEDYYDR
jgi:hypothetical protein